MNVRSSTKKGNEYEDHIARLLRACSFHVRQKVRIPGVKTDIIARKTLPIGDFPILVECKDQERRITVDEIKRFKQEYDLFKTKYPFGMACFISSHGFTEDAKEAGDASGIWCITESDLERGIIDFSAYIEQMVQAYESQGIQRGMTLKSLYTEQDAYLISHKEKKSFSEVFYEWLSGTTNCLFVLSDYGTGKTSMTRSYSVKLAYSFLKDQERLPLLILLRSTGRIQDVEDFILKHLRKYCLGNLSIQGVRYLLENKPMIIFLDGLDEMGIEFPAGATINHIINLSEFFQKYPRVKIVITARTHYFRDEKEIANLWGEQIEIASQLGTQKLIIKEDFICCYILPFNHGQKCEFLKKARPKDADVLIKDFRLQEALWDLASRPILFEMILDSIDEVGGKLDWDNQTDLYKHYTNKWLMREEYRGVITTGLKRWLTEILAKELWLTGADSIHWRELLHFLSKQSINTRLPHDIETISSEMRTASFLISGKEGYFSFAHPSFLEYFLASYLFNNIKHDGDRVLQEKFLSNLTRQFFSDLTNKNHQMLAALNDLYSLALKKQSITCLTNLTHIYANLRMSNIANDIASILVCKPSEKHVQTALHSAFSRLLISCCGEPDFLLPEYKLINVDTIRNPITDEIIARKGSIVNLDKLKKYALLQFGAFRIKVVAR